MSSVKRILCAGLEGSVFHQITMFCAAGLSMSLMAVYVYDFRITDWL
jgi:hypothetical protein